MIEFAIGVFGGFFAGWVAGGFYVLRLEGRDRSNVP